MSEAHADAPGDDLFGEVISTYTDEDALDDGILVDLSQFTNVRFAGTPINRMTSRLFEALKPFLDLDPESDAKQFGLALSSMLLTKCALASGDPGNTGEIGDICSIPPNLWLVRNEVGGWTVMYPEDY